MRIKSQDWLLFAASGPLSKLARIHSRSMVLQCCSLQLVRFGQHAVIHIAYIAGKLKLFCGRAIFHWREE